MGWVVKIILLVFCILVTIYAVKRWPVVSRYSSCYQTAYQQYDETGLMVKRSGMQGDLVVCEEKKAFLLAGLECREKIQNLYPLSPNEQYWNEAVARWLRFGSKDFETMITEHNQACQQHPGNLRLNVRTQQWF